MPSLSFILRYFRYLHKSVTAHGLHSPYMYQLMTEVIEKSTGRQEVILPERLREKLLASKEKIQVTDLGGGSHFTRSDWRQLRLLARYSGRRPGPGKLLYRLVKHFNPDVVLELGTSLGIGSLYLKAALPSARVVTIEGCPNIARLARRNISESGASDVEVIEGAFDAVLTIDFIKRLNPRMILFDGNHRKAPTIDFFNRLADVATSETVFIFDDIHWSEEMEEAWESIKADKRVRVTIDLFIFGVVLFRKEMSKQHFVLRNWDCF